MHKPDTLGVPLSKRDFLKAAACGACALCLAGVAGRTRTASAQSAQRGLIKRKPSPWFSAADEGAIVCELCPRRCRIAPGQRGRCRVRENRDGRAYTLVYGNPCLVQLDPVERKPFFHVLPGTRALSISTAGCNIACKFCEVWDMALVAPEEVHAYDMPPEEVVKQAKAAEARSVSYAFGEPVVFHEYMAATAALAKKEGLLNLLHTNGYIAREPLDALAEHLDAVNVDLKSFDPAFYRDVCDGELAPVLETLKHLKEKRVHVEITHILIPTLNDDLAQLRKMCLWIRDELGAEVPVHFARFYPLYRLANLPPTPVTTIERARELAFETGLRYVYVGRITGHEGENTFCPECRKPVIERMGFVIEKMHLKDGTCSHCGAAIAGRWV